MDKIYCPVRIHCRPFVNAANFEPTSWQARWEEFLTSHATCSLLIVDSRMRILKSVFSMIPVRTWVPVVSRQKTGLQLVDQIGQPIRDLFFWQETTWHSNICAICYCNQKGGNLNSYSCHALISRVLVLL